MDEMANNFSECLTNRYLSNPKIFVTDMTRISLGVFIEQDIWFRSKVDLRNRIKKESFSEPIDMQRPFTIL
ncbi:hypothetical protein TNCV_1119721 [Trichonephila clavipes]|uniref:Uncharacterized protein n=1 Tax=Trichonephila clavipes TaxID=2585209 RepID=A0A8X6VS88_TRICX|nr:hypothetical protein TNCV_1119721 [Trichonephila clavipes]